MLTNLDLYSPKQLCRKWECQERLLPTYGSSLPWSSIKSWKTDFRLGAYQLEVRMFCTPRFLDCTYALIHRVDLHLNSSFQRFAILWSQHSRIVFWNSWRWNSDLGHGCLRINVPKTPLQRSITLFNSWVSANFARPLSF